MFYLALAVISHRQHERASRKFNAAVQQCENENLTYLNSVASQLRTHNTFNNRSVGRALVAFHAPFAISALGGGFKTSRVQTHYFFSS